MFGVESEEAARQAERLDQFRRRRDFVAFLNNGCERDLRSSVIQCKVTNGHHAKWAAYFETAVRTATDTARLGGAGPFQTILQTVAS